MLSVMFQALVITFREGIEAFLIVAVSIAYLRKSGRGELLRAVRWGIAAALAVSVVGGYLLYKASNQEWLEGPLAIIAAVSVAAMTIHMWRAGRHMKGAIEGRLHSSSERAGSAAFAGVFLFTGLMIGREGIETVLLLLQIRQVPLLIVGAILGVAGASAVALLWSRYGHRVPMTLFLQMTAIFLFVFVVQLFISGVHEMSEQNLLPYSVSMHEATEAWGPESRFGHVLMYLLVVAPFTWLAISKKIILPAKTSHGTGSPTAR